MADSQFPEMSAGGGWYILGQEHNGAYTVSELKAHYLDGYLSQSTLVWADGCTEWQPLSSVTGLFADIPQNDAPAVTSHEEDEFETWQREVREAQSEAEGNVDDDQERPATPPDGEEEFTDDDGTRYKWDRSLKAWVPQNLAENLDDAFKSMQRIDKFEEKHFRRRPEYRVIGELMNRLKVAKGKENFLLQVTLNRALRMVDCKDVFDPNNPTNYGVIQLEERGFFVVASQHVDLEEEEEEDEQTMRGRKDDDDDLEFDVEKNNILLRKLRELDKKFEEKLAELDHSFEKKKAGKLLVEEIRD